MSSDTCAGCGARVAVGQGADTLWTSGESPGGLIIDLVDGGEVTLCFDCVGELPDGEVTRADVAAIGSEADDERDADADPPDE